jgi:hypothetical protein
MTVLADHDIPSVSWRWFDCRHLWWLWRWVSIRVGETAGFIGAVIGAVVVLSNHLWRVVKR